MNTQKLVITFVAAAACLGLAATPIAEAQEVLHARVSAEAGGSMVRGTADDDWSYATVNTLILPGDTLWADESGTLELEMSGGTFLRMADGSRAEIVQLPPSAFVRGWHGSFYVQRVSRSTGDASFDTPAGRVIVDRDSMVRIDIVPSGSTTVSVRWGEARVRTDQGSPVTVKEGRRVFIDPGLLPSTPVFFDRTDEDDFDAWNRERAKLLAVGPELTTKVPAASQHLGVYDLDQYGEWITVDNTRYWRPTVVREYVPYRVGYWSHVPTYGHVWVGNYPFSYVTSHYGRWTHHTRHGWMWTYRETWSPAWAATIRVGSHYVWTPLDPYNRPVRVSSTYFTVGGLPFCTSASSYITVAELYRGPARVRPVTQTVVNQTIVVGDVHIWNIGRHDRFRPRVPYREELPHARDYSPRRTIRGPETGTRSVAARSRVSALETSFGRRDFRPVETTGGRSVRTPASGLDRASAIRRASVPRDAPTDAESFVRSSTVTRAVRPSDSRRGTTIDTPHATTARDAGRTGDTPDRVSRITSSGDRTIRQTPRGEAPEQTTPDRPRTMERSTTIRRPERTPSTERSATARTPERTPSTDRSARTPDRPTTERSTPTRTQERTSVERDRMSPPARTQQDTERPTPPTISTPGRTIREAPSREPQRTPATDRSPRNITIAPRQSESPAQSQRSQPSRPQVTQPQRPTQPRVQERSTPSAPARQQTPTIRQQAPTQRQMRTPEPSQQQAPRGFSLPQSQPQTQRSRPQSQPSRPQIAQPQRSTRPQVQQRSVRPAPAPSQPQQRQQQAPSIRQRSQQSAPSARQQPSISSPRGSSITGSAGRSITQPSRSAPTQQRSAPSPSSAGSTSRSPSRSTGSSNPTSSGNTGTFSRRSR